MEGGRGGWRVRILSSLWARLDFASISEVCPTASRDQWEDSGDFVGRDALSLLVYSEGNAKAGLLNSLCSERG